LPPVQLFIIVSALVIFPLAWMRGGHPERAVVTILLVAYVSGPFVQSWQWGRLLAGVAVVDLVVWGAFLWLALRHDRWWLLLAAAAQTLNLVAHAALVMTPSLTTREHVAAQWVFTLVSLYALLLGVFERHLAGERPAAPSLTARTRRPAA
jgi:hypothetical protein